MIKFRAWDNECKVIRDYDELKGLTLDALDASDFKLEQYTGLKDANGKEIYEGDIIVSKPTEPKYEPLKIGAVKRSKARAGWCYETATATGEYNIWTSGKYRTYEVIGNVHENHELLEEV
ncbi:YopX family protein [Pediococcus pentosaceus]|uniref:YopX family protein n=1 Tax=Pediococcus pentosaceus TaxID=1255 RepID=UPI002E363627|nr:YopX family protein [Pediococcus pentosaceus]